jgi:hypothetical protein
MKSWILLRARAISESGTSVSDNALYHARYAASGAVPRI